MCLNLSGLLMRNIAIDFGTVNTLIAIKGRGIVLREPSAVAVSADDLHEPLAFGREAMQMLGRTPGGINVVYPMRDGVVADYVLSAEMLKYFIQMALGHKVGALGVRLVLCLPLCVTEVERRALVEAARSAGARDVLMLDEPLAAAVGAELPVFEPVGSMVVDIGGGTTDVALISLGGAVLSDSIKIAGDKFDDAIVRYMRKKHNLLIGERTAEEMKIRIGSAYPRREQLFIDVKGRNLISGLPQAIVVGSNEMIDALEEPLQAILESVRTMFEKTPPELASDVAENGICLTGGGALLYGIDKFISEHTKVPCYIAEDPISCVAIGTGKVLENIDSFTRGAIYDYRRGEYYTE